jgi:hypothetical protein
MTKMTNEKVEGLEFTRLKKITDSILIEDPFSENIFIWVN